MSRVYGVAFNSQTPNSYPSLAPTFITFKRMDNGNDITPPAITQLSTTGIYQFTFNATLAHYFLLDGITVSSAADRYVFGILDPSDQIDVQLYESMSLLTGYNSTLAALGTTNIALNITGAALGTTSVALGTTSVAIGTSLTAQSASIYAASNTLVALGITNFAIGTTLTGLVGNPLSSIGSTSVDPSDLFGFMKRHQEFNEGNSQFNKSTGVWTIQTRGATTFASKTLGNNSTLVSKS